MMAAKTTLLLLLLCSLACTSAYYLYNSELDDDYYNRQYRTVSYGMPATTNYGRYYVNNRFPSYSRYNFYNPQTVNYGGHNVYEDLF